MFYLYSVHLILSTVLHNFLFTILRALNIRDIMLLSLSALIAGLALLIWSAGRFVDGSSATAHHLGMSPLLVGMIIVGFGTSAPEMTVSAISAWQGNPGIALGNAYGSNICNIALILGLCALVKPVIVHSKVISRELPLLLLMTVLTAVMLSNGQISRRDAVILLTAFALYMVWCLHESRQLKHDPLSGDIKNELTRHVMPLNKAIFFVIVGLALLIISSRVLVWGAVGIAHALGVSDLIIGLTIVAVGTSLPELASSIAAVQKNEYDIALGNVIGSNMFNTLIVVGIAGIIHPLAVDPMMLKRDVLVMGLLTLAIMVIGCGLRKPGRINRVEGGGLLLCYIGYLTWIVVSAVN